MRVEGDNVRIVLREISSKVYTGDNTYSGRPTAVDSEAVETSPSISTRRLSVDIPRTSVVGRLHALCNGNRRCREVPHEVTEIQARRRIEIAEKWYNKKFEKSGRWAPWSSILRYGKTI